ncbi:Hsp70 family protein [Lachnospiraceae bacterium C1.1]|nr:Hsp70 family protein [Lachnospiraceae bacterium C1.1]
MEDKFGFNPEDFEDDDELFFDVDPEVDEDNSSQESYSEEDAETPSDFSEEEYDSDGGFDFERPEPENDSRTTNSSDSESENDEDNEKAESEEEGNDFSGRAIGIDLGTTNSVIAYIDKNGAVKFLKVKNEILIPSFIFFKDKDTVFYGKKAKSYAKAMSQGAAISLFKKHLRTDSDRIKVRLPKVGHVGKDGRRYYVIDTNVFIDQPEILECFSETDVIILPITVEQELEYRVSDINTKYSAERALEEITSHHDVIQFVESDISILPEDFFKNFSEDFNNANNDNKILSIALKYKEQNVTLISSDNRLAKLKASFVGVHGVSLKEFNTQRLNESKYDEFELTGTEATTMFLRYLKQEAEKSIKETVSKAVITVPATFNIVEIENTRKAGLDAGFTEIHIEKEPTAAAIAYNIDANDETSTFIYDFGGGTFDVSIIKSDGEGNFEVCATAGNSKLGGEDLTQKVEEYVYDYLEDHYDLSMYSEEDSELNNEHYVYNVKTIYWAAENCKMELSASENTTMTLMDIYISDDEQKSVFIDLSRQEFESIIKPTINQTIAEMNNGLSKADMMISDVDNIILAGGTSLIPCINEQVERYFGRKPSADKNAATLIAEGAAIIADYMFGENHLIKMQPQVFDMTYEDFGVALEKWNYSCIIPAGTTLPATAEKKYSLVEDEQAQLNIKVLSRNSEAQEAQKTYDPGVEYLDELIMTNIPPMKIDEVDVVVRFEITKQYELKTDVTLIKKDGAIVDKGNMSINRQSMM